MSAFQSKYSHGLSVIYGENVSFSTNGSGDASWTFPTAFPTDIVTVHVTPCDTALGSFIPKPHAKSSGNTDRTKVTVRIYNPDGSVAASFGPYKVNITAFGY